MPGVVLEASLCSSPPPAPRLYRPCLPGRQLWGVFLSMFEVVKLSLGVTFLWCPLATLCDLWASLMVSSSRRVKE